MRILAILTPTDKWGTKTAYTNLRKFLIKYGYHRIAPEVFMRITTNRKTAQKHFDRLKEYAPATGEVRILRLTEKQYANITYLTGCPDEQEKPLVRTVTSCYNESLNMMLWYRTDQYLEEGCI